jgi:hypothetical protein
MPETHIVMSFLIFCLTLSLALCLTSSCALPQFAHGPNHRSYGFSSRKNRFEPRCFGYDPCPHRGDRFSCRSVFLARGSYTVTPQNLEFWNVTYLLNFKTFFSID